VFECLSTHSEPVSCFVFQPTIFSPSQDNNTQDNSRIFESHPLAPLGKKGQRLNSQKCVRVVAIFSGGDYEKLEHRLSPCQAKINKFTNVRGTNFGEKKGAKQSHWRMNIVYGPWYPNRESGDSFKIPKQHLYKARVC